jgi:hypothetical protein
MKVTEKDLRTEGIRDSQVDGVKIAEGTVPIEDSDYFSDADEYLFSTRSRYYTKRRRI